MTTSSSYPLYFFKHPLIRFAFVGLISTLVDILVLNILHHWGATDFWAAGLGFLAGTVNGYILNSRLVFYKDRSTSAFTKYFLVSFGGFWWTELLVYTLHTYSHFLSLNRAKVIAVILVFSWNFSLSKLWAFR